LITQRKGYFNIGITLLIVLGIAIAFQGLGLLIVVVVAFIQGVSPLEVDPMVTLVSTGFAQLIIMLGGTIWLAKLLGQSPMRTFRLQGFYETPPLVYVIAVPLMLSAQATGSLIAVLWGIVLKHLPAFYGPIEHFEKKTQSTISNAVLDAHTLLPSMVVFITIAIIPALAEETVFRGFAQSNIELSGKTKPRPYVAIFWASLAFAAIHAEVTAFPGLLVLGLTMAWMSYRTGNLFVGSVGHLINNGAIVMALLLMPQGPADSSATAAILSDSGTSAATALVGLAFAVPAFGFCLYFFNYLTRDLTARYASYDLYEPEPEVEEIPGHYNEELH